MSDNERTIQNIWKWQTNPMVHPLTCGNDSSHAPLVPVIGARGKVVLMCTDCEYKQYTIPDFLVARKEEQQ